MTATADSVDIPVSNALSYGAYAVDRNVCYGTKQTSISTLNMTAFGGKADTSDRVADVR